MSELESLEVATSDASHGSLSGQNEDLAAALIGLGASTHVVKTMLCLNSFGPISSKDLQTNCGLRQPEISTAIKVLKQRSLVEVRLSGTKNRGRPSHIYELTKTLHACIDQIVNQAKNEVDTLQKGIDEVELIMRKQ
ncbi:MAG: hypothetical protein OSA38_06725 [Candidatus Poseidoniaceae archaeon]|nr:hypothetical protein [Candidatus Poseidoniaceae archaeon]|tara:strand:+ start:213 stop:623 length:411 start_codon:yes stop_codon:yes gene_type:complete